jgi:hypothetical protein
MQCTCNDILRIPEGNGFRIGICRSNVAPANDTALTFQDIDNIQVSLTWIMGKVPVSYQITQCGDIIVIGKPFLQKETYGIEIIGTYNGQPLRWKERRVFRIVDDNSQASMQQLETFGADIYWLSDILEVDTEGDTMIFTTHAHASLDNDTLTLQSTDKTKVTVEGDTLVFTILKSYVRPISGGHS